MLRIRASTYAWGEAGKGHNSAHNRGFKELIGFLRLWETLQGEGACPRQRDARIWFSHSLGLLRAKEDRRHVNSRTDQAQRVAHSRLDPAARADPRRPAQTRRAGAAATIQKLRPEALPSTHPFTGQTPPQASCPPTRLLPALEERGQDRPPSPRSTGEIQEPCRGQY